MACTFLDVDSDSSEVPLMSSVTQEREIEEDESFLPGRGPGFLLLVCVYRGADIGEQ